MMIYIGQTRDPKLRKRIHFQQLRDNYHVNIHLQAAYNKYGRQAFYFEVIESGITEDVIDSREQYWINHYDSFRNGFNRTPGGNRGGGFYKPVVWNGVWYESVSECSRVLGISMKWRIDRGYTNDREVQIPGDYKKVGCVWNGISYSSKTDCANALGIARKSLQNRLNRGYICDADVPVQEKPCTWNGRKYPTQADAARACGIATSVMATRIKNGYTCDMDMPGVSANAKRRPCTWNGKTYSSISEAARDNGLKVTALHYRIRQGYTCDDDMK
jgi:hypothetical protein